MVATADSLRAEGQLYTDSVNLAEAYETLDKWQVLYPDDYAHACYHYGRILRKKGNPALAMECFINCIHSRTSDHHILGRAYSNIGSICHLAEEYDLSYAMYACSAQEFLQLGDSTAYFYALNDMAFESAEQNNKDFALFLISIIEQNCTSPHVLTKILETKAEIYNNSGPQDSAIYYINQLNARGYQESLGTLIKAQAFSRLGMSDSAIVYANLVLTESGSSFQDRFNALYILSHNDTTLRPDEIRNIASEREGIRYYEYEPIKTQLTFAIQVLRQNLDRKPDRRWLYAILWTIVIIGISLTIYIRVKYKRRQLLSQQIDALQTQNDATIAEMKANMETRCALLAHSPDMKSDLCWNDYEQLCMTINRDFGWLARKLQQTYQLSEREVRLCILTLFNVRYDQMAEMLFYAPNGIGKFKLRIANKLGTTAKNMRDFLLNLATEG
ncbi:MAG: hypothetical protein J5612_05500 [Paludibacteraceae bacterium]|nr:hypothetical protein [Paludibacteraceae bacterium]